MSEKVETIKAMYDKVYALQMEIWKAIDGSMTLDELSEIRIYAKKKEEEFNKDRK